MNGKNKQSKNYCTKHVTFETSESKPSTAETELLQAVYLLLEDMRQLDEDKHVSYEQKKETVCLSDKIIGYEVHPKTITTTKHISDQFSLHRVESGVCVVFVNDQFETITGSIIERKNSAIILQRIKQFFTQLRNFRLQVHSNFSAHEILEHTGSLRTSSDDTSIQYNCVICIHIGIGCDGVMVGSDAKTFTAKDLLQMTALQSQESPIILILKMASSRYLCGSIGDLQLDPDWSKRWSSGNDYLTIKNQLLLWVQDPFPLEELLSIWQTGPPSCDLVSGIVCYLQWARTSNNAALVHVKGSLAKLVYFKRDS